MTSEKISEFADFFAKNYMAKLTQSKDCIILPFTSLSEWSVDLASELLDSPEDYLKMANLAVQTLVDDKSIYVRFTGLPKIQHRNVWETRKEDVSKFIALTGIINKSSSIIHLCQVAKFECHNCGSIIVIAQNDGKFIEPFSCSCGRKGKFILIDKEFTDIIKLGVIDDLMARENVDRSIAREKLAILSHDLTSLEVDQKIKPGKKVILNGYFKYQQKSGSAEFDSIFHVNSIEFVKVGWDTVKASKAEEEEIIKLAKQKDIVPRLAESIADVEGFKEAKIACLLMLTGAPHKYDENGHLVSRGTTHILLIGNPGGGKTFLAKRAGSISPIYSFASAATASGKGLVAAVSQDKDIGAWVIYPGVVAMASKGVCVIDEIDKTHKEDYGDHNNAMNDMTVIIAKGNVKGKLETETNYLATANPENRIFTEYDTYANQIDMPKDFQDRFDLILPMVSPTDKIAQEKIMDIMLERHTDDKGKKSWNPEFTHDFIQKYIAYCRKNNPNPILSTELFAYIKKKLVELMRPRSEEQSMISFRHLESILRFAYESARLKLRDITEEDVDLGFNLKKKSFVELGIISGVGGFSWAKLENIEEKVISEKEIIHDVLKEILPDTHTFGDWQEIIRKCKEKGVDEDIAEEHIHKLMTKGDFYEPKRGYLRRI